MQFLDNCFKALLEVVSCMLKNKARITENYNDDTFEVTNDSLYNCEYKINVLACSILENISNA